MIPIFGKRHKCSKQWTIRIVAQNAHAWPSCFYYWRKKSCRDWESLWMESYTTSAQGTKDMRCLQALISQFIISDQKSSNGEHASDTPWCSDDVKGIQKKLYQRPHSCKYCRSWVPLSVRLDLLFSCNFIDEQAWDQSLIRVLWSFCTRN